MFAQVDDEGNRYQLLSEIVDHRRDGSEITQQDAFAITYTETRRCCETTK